VRGRNTPSEKGSDHRVRRRVELTGKLHCDTHRPIAAEDPHIGRREIVATHVTVMCVSKCAGPPQTLRAQGAADDRNSMIDPRPVYLQIDQRAVLKPYLFQAKHRREGDDTPVQAANEAPAQTSPGFIRAIVKGSSRKPLRLTKDKISTDVADCDSAGQDKRSERSHCVYSRPPHAGQFASTAEASGNALVVVVVTMITTDSMYHNIQSMAYAACNSRSHPVWM
jgi:hypothetical protein